MNACAGSSSTPATRELKPKLQIQFKYPYFKLSLDLLQRFEARLYHLSAANQQIVVCDASQWMCLACNALILLHRIFKQIGSF